MKEASLSTSVAVRLLQSSTDDLCRHQGRRNHANIVGTTLEEQYLEWVNLSMGCRVAACHPTDSCDDTSSFAVTSQFICCRHIGPSAECVQQPTTLLSSIILSPRATTSAGNGPCAYMQYERVCTRPIACPGPSNGHLMGCLTEGM